MLGRAHLAFYYSEDVQVWRMAALQVAVGKRFATHFGVQVSFKFVQVWVDSAAEFRANSGRDKGFRVIGNWPRKVFPNYREFVRAADAEKWFGNGPEAVEAVKKRRAEASDQRPANVVDLPKAAAA